MGTKGRSWFIYKDDDNNELASIRDVRDFNEIIKNLEDNIQEGAVDIADKVALIDAIEKSLPEGMSWPGENCIDVLINASEKFLKTARSKEYFHDESLYKAFEWITFNINTIKKWHSLEWEKPERKAIIKCDENCKESVKKDLIRFLKETCRLLNTPENEMREVHVTENEKGLDVFYPTGELYGYVNDYVESVVGAFRKIKKNYNQLSIQGSVYYLEQVTDADIEFEFYCEPDDKELIYERL